VADPGGPARGVERGAWRGRRGGGLATACCGRRTHADQLRQGARPPWFKTRARPLIIDGHPALVARARGADGAHSCGHRGHSRPRSARSSPTASRAAGASGPRHDAMARGQSAALTTSCSASRTSTSAGHPLEAILERIAWWSEVFEIPCVGLCRPLRRDRAARGGGSRLCRRRRLDL